MRFNIIKNIFLCIILMFLKLSTLKAELYVDKTDYTDINNILKSYNKIKEENKNNIKDDKNIYVFISFSMSDNMLKKYFVEAQNIKQKSNLDVVFVLRGFYKNSFKETLTKIDSIISKLEDKNVKIITDPTMFKQYSINNVPTIIKKKYSDYDKIAGAITIKYALEQFNENYE